MARKWVVNASPFIVLSRIHHEHLLVELSDEIVIPQIVADEIYAGPVFDQACQKLDSGDWNIINTPVAPPELQAWDLGAGETAVLSYAMAYVTGTLGVILLARQKELIVSAVDVLKQLRSDGFRLNDKVISDALAKTSGEVWPYR